MADIFSKEKRSEVMSRISPKNTKPELLVFKFLSSNRIYFQKHYRKVPGSPDVAFPRRKLAIIIDGDFWHGWKFVEWKHKIPEGYWRDKIQANIDRDRRSRATLRKLGWKYLRVWEHELVPRKRAKTFAKILAFIESNRI